MLDLAQRTPLCFLRGPIERVGEDIEPLRRRSMTVAAVILSASAEGSLEDTLGQARVRRLTDLGWAGGALPIIVVSPDPDGAVKAALAGSEAVYGSPAPAEVGEEVDGDHGAGAGDGPRPGRSGKSQGG